MELAEPIKLPEYGIVELAELAEPIKPPQDKIAELAELTELPLLAENDRKIVELAEHLVQRRNICAIRRPTPTSQTQQSYIHEHSAKQASFTD